MTTMVFPRNDGGLPAQLNGVGTTQSGAPALTGSINTVNSTAGQTAAVLPRNVPNFVTVRVLGGTAATIFPPVGGAINGGTVNASVSVASGSIAVFLPHPNGLDFTAFEAPNA